MCRSCACGSSHVPDGRHLHRRPDLRVHQLVQNDGLTLSSDPYGSVFYLTTGFHGLHVTGGLIAFLLVLGRTYAAKSSPMSRRPAAIVVSYYWHFVDVVWIGLFATIYGIQ